MNIHWDKNCRQTLLGGLAGGLMLAAATVLAAPAQAQTFKVLHAFAGSPDGSTPWGSLLLRGGILYGTTYGGGNSSGTLFELDLSTRKETVLYAFSGADGAKPVSTLYRDSSGNLWGTTAGGGIYLNDWGTIFQLSPADALTTMYNFQGSDGAYPNAGLVRDSAGNFYGATYQGAAHGLGTIFRFNGVLKTVHTFTGGLDGGGPGDSSGLLLLQGKLYGTTFVGGSLNCGTVFEIDLSTGKETTLYNFSGMADGFQPIGGLITDGQGNLFGTTTGGGSGSGGSGNGVVFEVNIASRQETVLHAFIGADGSYPYAGVIRDSQGFLYGTTERGGTAGDGTVWKLDTQGFLTVLHSFTNSTDGEVPIGGLTLDSRGNLYGAASAGGKFGAGTVFEVTP